MSQQEINAEAFELFKNAFVFASGLIGGVGLALIGYCLIN